MITRCRSCGALLGKEPLITIENMPAGAQHLPGPEDRDKEKGITVRLCACTGCGLVQLDNDPVPYYRDVIRSGGYSTTMDRLRRQQYDGWFSFCEAEGRSLAGKKILEAGCGQGEFLRILQDYPVRAFGMEHSHELVVLAREQGLTVEEAYPEREDQVFRDGPFDAFTSFNFLEHQPDPLLYLRTIAANLTEGAYALITVPSFEYILEQNSFYELIPDHLMYFTEETLNSLLDRCGFMVRRTERVNRDTISVIAEKRKAPDIGGLIRRKDTIAEETQSLAESYRKAGKRLAVWGASHQGFTLLSVAGLKDAVSCIIDSAPFKQGRIAPASHIEIISPDTAVKRAPDGILIVAPGYTDEIAGIIKERFPAGTDILTLMTDHIERIL